MKQRPTLSAPRLFIVDTLGNARELRRIMGGDGTDDVDGLLAEAESFEGVTDEQLGDLESRLIAAAEDARDAQDVDTLTRIADAVDSVRAEAASRAEQAEQRAAETEALMNRITPSAEADTEGEGDEETPAETEGDPEGDETPADEGGDTPAEDDDAETPEAVAAAAGTTPAPGTTPARPTPGQAARRRPANRRPARATEAEIALVAAGDVPGRSAGQRYENMREVAEAWALKTEAMLAGGSKGRAAVLRIDVRDQYPAERMLGKDADVNRERLEAIEGELTQEAITAAGGLCAPLQVRYDRDTIGVETRPIRDALPRFGADRGGIRYYPPVTISGYNDAPGGIGAGVNHYTEAQDASGSAYPKGCWTITCPDEAEVKVGIVTKCAKVGNLELRTFPENFRAFWRALGIIYAREAENGLWAKMEAASTAVTMQPVLGTTRDVLAGLDRARAAYVSRHRLSDQAPLRMLVPHWLRDNMRVDLARQMPGDNTLAVADAEIARFFAVRNITVTYTLEGDGQEFGVQGDGPLDGWKNKVTALVFHEGAFTYLDGGTLDFGTEIRDSQLNETNDTMAFMEGFESVAFVGHESLAIEFDICADGSTSGTVDINPCGSGS